MNILFTFKQDLSSGNYFEGQVQVSYDLYTKTCSKINYSDLSFGENNVSFDDELELMSAIEKEVKNICLLG